MSKLIAIDFDGTIASDSHSIGEDYIGDIIPGAREFILTLKQHGYNICIHTCRDAEQVKAWLKRFNLLQQIDFITRNKPPCLLYLDDRSVRFNGDFRKALEEIENFRPWWEQQ